MGDLSKSYSGGTPSTNKKEYYGGKIPFIRSGEINSTKTELFLTDEGIQNSSAKLVKKGDILYAMYGATSGEVAISKIDGAINQAVLAIKTNIDDSNNFIYQWLRNNKNSILETFLQGGQGNLSGRIIKNLLLITPSSVSEQEAIGKLFVELENLITVNQRKLLLTI